MTTTVTMTTMTEHEYDDYGWLRIEDDYDMTTMAMNLPNPPSYFCHSWEWVTMATMMMTTMTKDDYDDYDRWRMTATNLSDPPSCLRHSFSCLRGFGHTGKQTRARTHSFNVFSFASAALQCSCFLGFSNWVLFHFSYSSVFAQFISSIHFIHAFCPLRSLCQVWVRTMH